MPWLTPGVSSSHLLSGNTVRNPCVNIRLGSLDSLLGRRPWPRVAVMAEDILSIWGYPREAQPVGGRLWGWEEEPIMEEDLLSKWNHSPVLVTTSALF